MKKILLSVGMIVFVAAAAAGATGAFFSDSETSTGNVLAAGAIDLGIDNTSYYNGIANSGTSWNLDYDIDDTVKDNPDTPNVDESQIPRAFFNFNDLKPGDYGEDTISIHVSNNDAWVCADVTVTANDDVTCTEPENDPNAENSQCSDTDANQDGIGDNGDLTDGDLVQQLDFLYWADDGDNVLETDEVASATTTTGLFGASAVGATTTIALVDSTHNLWGGSGPLAATSAPVYLGKAWCFGTIGVQAVSDTAGATNPAGNNDGNNVAGEPTDGGYTCTGASGITNASQTDVVKATVSFRAEQARHNADFQCIPQGGITAGLD